MHFRFRCYRTPGFAAQANHAQPGDPAKLAKVVVEFAAAPEPPVRLPLGSDTVAKIEEKNAATAALLAKWRAVSVSTDFANETGS